MNLSAYPSLHPRCHELLSLCFAGPSALHAALHAALLPVVFLSASDPHSDDLSLELIRAPQISAV